MSGFWLEGGEGTKNLDATTVELVASMDTFLSGYLNQAINSRFIFISYSISVY